MRFTFTGVIILICGALLAQAPLVSGRVIDEEGQPLIGATVSVLNSIEGAATDTGGYYRFRLPTGRIRLHYSYLGYASYDTVVATQFYDTLTIDVTLRAQAFTGREVVVTARRLARAQAQALAIQRISPSLQTIIHSEVFNRYPDVTLAETVQRLPSVTISRDRGEGEFISIRGIPEQYTLISMNGLRLPSIQPEADRASSLDFIQSNLIEEVRLIKSLTPDQDADAIGGTVDFRLKEPIERPELQVQLGYGFNQQSSEIRDLKKRIVQGTAYVSQPLSEEENMYFLMAGSFYQTGRGSIRERWQYGENNQLLRREVADLDNNRRRFGLIGSVQLSPSIYHRLTLGYNFSGFLDDEIRRMARFDFASGREQRLTLNRREKRQVHLVNLDAESNYGILKVDYSVSYASGSQLLPDRTRFRYGRPYDFRGISAAERSTLGSTEALPGDPLAFEQVSIALQDIDEDIFISGINFTLPLNQSGNSNLRTGIRYRVSDRVYGAFTDRALPTGTPPSLAPGSYDRAGLTFDDADFDALAIDRTFTPSLFDSESAYDATERVTGGYLMNTTNWTPRFTSVAGVRLERTDYTYRQLVRPDSAENNYSNWFPSINMTYRLSDRKQFRADFYSAINRPPYATLIPFDLIQTESGIITKGNTNVDPVIAQNIDFTYERYGSNDGLVSAGFFMKWLDNVVVENVSGDTLNDEPIDVIRLDNIDRAWVYGFELVWYQALGRGSNPWRHFNINGNYNLNFSGMDTELYRDNNLPLINSARHVANLSFVYNNPSKGISLVLAGVYRDRYLDRFQGSRLIYRGQAIYVDFSADYRLKGGLTFYLRLNNLTDQPTTDYLGSPGNTDELPFIRERFGSWGTAGLRWNLF